MTYFSAEPFQHVTVALERHVSELNAKYASDLENGTAVGWFDSMYYFLWNLSFDIVFRRSSQRLV